MHRRDQRHKEAARVWKAITGANRPITTTDLVMAETQMLLTRRLGTSSGIEFMRRLLARPDRVVWNDQTTTVRALGWLDRFSDRPLSLTDAVSFAVMEIHAIREAFTFDRDFQDAGFTVATGKGTR